MASWFFRGPMDPTCRMPGGSCGSASGAGDTPGGTATMSSRPQSVASCRAAVALVVTTRQASRTLRSSRRASSARSGSLSPPSCASGRWISRTIRVPDRAASASSSGCAAPTRPSTSATSQPTNAARNCCRESRSPSGHGPSSSTTDGGLPGQSATTAALYRWPPDGAAGRGTTKVRCGTYNSIRRVAHASGCSRRVTDSAAKPERSMVATSRSQMWPATTSVVLNVPANAGWSSRLR